MTNDECPMTNAQGRIRTTPMAPRWWVRLSFLRVWGRLYARQARAGITPAPQWTRQLRLPESAMGTAQDSSRCGH